LFIPLRGACKLQFTAGWSVFYYSRQTEGEK
jgi:hypothetical protein